MIQVEPLIHAEDYPAFQAMMPKEPAFKDAPTGIFRAVWKSVRRDWRADRSL